ncbi:DUF4249 family protein [Capnocytophaga sp. H2931]|uniref:DUF4249 family protein n=1 Tax=Capnocytophaga sp. H2931 TaxID=1945657 RepID=UPI000BB1D420|nr:DUF4249 family protein [Capnocytophaga sp. H2931]ATA74337.1 hypothetical protein CGC52_02105 [Capnocytophaga sp. H2931]
MRKIYTIICMLSFALSSCEEVITLDIDNEKPQLVVDAYIDWKKGDTQAIPVVHLSYTTDYYSNLPSPKATGAAVKITTYHSEEYILQEISHQQFANIFPPTEYPTVSNHLGGTIYAFPDGITPVLGRDYILHIEYEGEKYVAKARMKETAIVDASRTQQNDNGGIFGNKTEARFFFNGFANEENAYLVRMKHKQKEDRYTLDDKFIADQKFFFTTNGFQEELKKGDQIYVSLYRISYEYKQIIDFLADVAINDQGRGAGPPSNNIPARILGNVTHETNPKKNPLGAFRVGQYSEFQYIVK